MNFKLNSSVELIGSTSKIYDHSVGYHDIKPFNKVNDKLIHLHRYPLNNTNQSNNLKVDICLWDYQSSIVEKIDETNAWSWEQGSRLQWLNENELIFNKIIEEKLISCIYNIYDKKKLILNNPIYSISHKNEKFLNINYSRLWNFWKNYGYDLKNKNQNFEQKPTKDGVFLCDFNNNKKLVLSINDAVELCRLQNINKTFFITHPTFSPGGDKFVSLLRFFNDTGILISYFICTNLNNSKSQVLARERVSHFEWINNDSIVVWSRNLSPSLEKVRFNKFLEKYFIANVKKIIKILSPKFQQKILSTHYHLINLNNPNKVTKLDKDILTEDGHPQISENKKYLITDTYANSLGFQKLMLYDIEKNKTHDIGEFKVAEYLPNNNLKYDLHPRWNFKGNLISIDSSHEGSRQSYVINIEKLIKKIS